jgi:hypothetical protein
MQQGYSETLEIIDATGRYTVSIGSASIIWQKKWIIWYRGNKL